MNDLRIGFVGYGRHAQANLYPSIKALGYKISAVATTHEESALKASQDHNIPSHYTDYKEMLEKEQLDCIFICVQPQDILKILKDVIPFQIPIFVEKNVGFNTQEAQEIFDLTNKYKTHLTIGFMKRFAPIYVKAKELIEKGELGKVTSIHQIFTSRNFASNGKEYLLFAAIHYIDLIRFYIGEVTEACGYESTTQDSFSQSFSIKAENGVIGSIYYSASPAWEGARQEITISGEKGYIKLSGYDGLTFHKTGEKLEYPRWQTVAEEEVSYKSMLTTGGDSHQLLYLNGFISEIKNFIESVKNKSNLVNNAEENFKTTKLVDLIYNNLKR